MLSSAAVYFFLFDFVVQIIVEKTPSSCERSSIDICSGCADDVVLLIDKSGGRGVVGPYRLCGR